MPAIGEMRVHIRIAGIALLDAPTVKNTSPIALVIIVIPLMSAFASAAERTISLAMVAVVC